MMNLKYKLTQSEIYTNVGFLLCTLILVTVQIVSHNKLNNQLNKKTEEQNRKIEVRERWRKIFESNPTLIRPIHLFSED